MAQQTSSLQFTPFVDEADIPTIKAQGADTCFIMRQQQPAVMYDPDGLDLVPHNLYRHGSERAMTEAFEKMVSDIRFRAEMDEIELFCRTRGEGFSNVVFFEGSDVVTYTVCTREKALQLAL